LERIHREEGNPALARRSENESDDEDALRLALLPAKRESLLSLRDRGRVDDIVFRRVQERLDREELRLAHPSTATPSLSE
jgi:CPA1 family monovalent cation:H+ antiporter